MKQLILIFVIALLLAPISTITMAQEGNTTNNVAAVLSKELSFLLHIYFLQEKSINLL